MIVTEVEIRNWRNICHARVALDRRVFAVGPNAGGKSNFLDVFRFLASVTRPGGGLFRAVEERAGVCAIHCRTGRGDGFEIAVTLGKVGAARQAWKYALGVQPCDRKDTRPVVVFEKVWRGEEQILDRPDREDRADPERLRETYLENVTTNGAFREIADFFAGVIFQHLFPQTARESIRQGSGIWPEAPRDGSVQSLLDSIVATPAAERNRRIRRIEAALKLAVPQLKSLGLAMTKEGRLQLETIFEKWRSADAVGQSQFSDGTLRLISILWTLLENESMLLLEEPELSLHPSVVRCLPGLIFRLKRRRPGQVIMTTHSPDLLSDPGIDGAEVLLCLPDPSGGASLVMASSLPEVASLMDAGLSAGEVVLPRSQPSRIEELGYFE